MMTLTKMNDANDLGRSFCGKNACFAKLVREGFAENALIGIPLKK